MINRKNRFHGPHAVRRLKGVNLHTPHSSARVCKNPKRTDFRLAVVVSKKVAPKAVTRNRIRRRVFEAIRNQGRLNNIPIDCVIYIKTEEIATMESNELQKEVAALTKKVLARVLN